MPVKILIAFFLIISLSIRGQNRQFTETIEFPEKISQYQIEVGLGVYDFTDIFNYDEEKKLNQVLRNYNNKTNRTISIVTFDSIAPYMILSIY